MTSNRLRIKLLLILMPVVCTVGILVSIWFHQELSSSAILSAKEQSKSHALRAVNVVDAHIRSLSKVATILSGDEAVRTLLDDSTVYRSIKAQSTLLKMFRSLAEVNSSYKEIYILNGEGRIVTMYTEDPFQPFVKESDWIASSIILPKNYGNQVIETVNGWRIVHSLPVYGEFGNGFIVVTRDTRFLNAEISPVSNAEQVTAILTADGSDFIFNASQGNRELYRAALNSAGSGFTELNGQKWVTSIEKTDNYTILSATDVQEKASNLEAMKNKALLIGLVTAFIVSFFVYHLLNILIFKRLNIISNVANKITKGEHDIELDTSRNDEIGEVFTAMNCMNDSIQEKTREVRKLAFFDALTGLNNKQCFIKKLQGYKTPTRDLQLTVFVINLKSFKQVNDTHGYDGGNDLLRELAGKLKSAVQQLRRNWNLDRYVVARGSADEFLVMINLPKGDRAPQIFSEKIRGAISSGIFINGTEVNTSCFIGWSQLEGKGKVPFRVYEEAEMALHAAKKKDEELVRFEQIMVDRIKDNKKLSDDINKAIEFDEFNLVFQPKVSTSTNQSNEFEALIRWQNEERGSVSPGVFIPFAEETGLIKGIDYWVMDQIARLIFDLESRGWRNFKISFNVSADRLMDGAFLVELNKALQTHKFNPEHMKIEITEHSLMHDIEGNIQAIKYLRSLGIYVALDDFGTGHSSLEYLMRLPVNELKIDRCFVKDVNTNIATKTLLSHIVAIGKAMGLNTVAEGVETAAELEVINQIGCDMVQGFLMHRPMPFEEMIEKFSDDNRSKNVA